MLLGDLQVFPKFFPGSLILQVTPPLPPFFFSLTLLSFCHFGGENSLRDLSSWGSSVSNSSWLDGSGTGPDSSLTCRKLVCISLSSSEKSLDGVCGVKQGQKGCATWNESLAPRWAKHD